jgi:hypothetical protein
MNLVHAGPLAYNAFTNNAPEASPNNRAGCQNKECKAAAVKITKGEFRYAIQVTINDHQSWQYRHWYAPFPKITCSTNLCRGCVTPKQIENLIETTGGDTDMVDGFDEVPAEYQEKIKFALENGHIPDEDWKGVSYLFQANALSPRRPYHVLVAWIVALRTIKLRRHCLPVYHC